MSIKFYIQSNELITELMAEMSKAEIRRFLTTGTYTGKLAAVKKEGSSHVAPIWFMLDYRKTGDNTGNIYFTTGSSSIKPKSKRDYAGIGAIIFTFFLIAIVTALTIYTAYQIAYGLSFEDIKKENQN